MTDLDDKLREQLRKLAEAESARLSESARQRVREAVLGSRPRANIGLLWLTVPALSLLAFLLWPEPKQPLMREPLIAAAPKAGPRPEQVVAGSPACASAPDEAGVALRKRGGQQRLELSRALIAGDPDAQLGLQVLSKCELGLELARGSVAVHARALQGGALWIQAGDVRLEVKGTVFSVARERNGEVRVALAEGSVELSFRGGHSRLRLEPGQVVSLSPGGDARREVLSSAEHRQLLIRLGLAAQAARSSPEMEPALAVPSDAAVEKVWQQGALPAFQPEPPEPGSSLQPDGRPMSKPQLVP